jgi:ubiquinone/menaquinone biosynthesis C-methylase UbiE
MEPNKIGIQHTCPWWLLFTFDNPLRKLIHDPDRILTGMVQPGQVVLDVGCGKGYFTLTLARLVGQKGQVFAVDLQEQMLAGLRNRAERAGLLDRIRLQRCTPDRVGVTGPVDFILAFWMVHEVRHPLPFLQELYQALKPGGSLLMVEPRIHVPGRVFEKTVDLAQRQGFSVVDHPQVRFSRAVLLSKQR